MKSMARVLLNGTYKAGQVKVLNSEYDATLTNKVLDLIEKEELDLSKTKTLILVPHTLPATKEKNYRSDEEQEPYLRFTIIGVVKDQPDAELGVVNIIGKVIYENVQHEFVLVKIQRGHNYEIIKINGVLDESLTNGKGSAVERLYNITAEIVKNSLYIVDSYQINRGATYNNNVVQFPNRNTDYEYRAA